MNKVCTRCRIEKPRSDFYPDHRPGRDLLSNCKACGLDKARIFRAKHGPRMRLLEKTVYARRKWNTHLRNHYGITVEDYEAMIAACGGKCMICGRTEPGGRSVRMHVDHDHASGTVRGILCTRCNQMIGYAGDDPDILLEAAAYLSSRRSVRSSLKRTGKSGAGSTKDGAQPSAGETS